MTRSVTTYEAAHQEGITPDQSQKPRWKSPFGPVWLIQPKSGSPLRVRPVAGAPGLLKLGVALRRSATANHPRLIPPSLWWRDEEQSWVAAPAPAGQLLDEQPPERFVWHEALALITPLAMALKDAHRRGLIHGAIAPWTVFFEQVTRRLTAVDFGLWSVEHFDAGPFCPPELRHRAGKLRPSPASDIHNLARLLIFLALSPEEALKDRPNFETIPAFAISALERALQPEPTRRPQTIDEFLSGLSFHTPISHSNSTPSGKERRRGRAREVREFETARHGEGIRFFLDQGDDESADGVFVYRNQHPQVFESLARLWEGAELNLIKPGEIEDSRGRKFLTAQESTIPVLEPHWPVSVSDVLAARGCPQRVLVDLRDPGTFSYHLSLGNLIHGFLEDLIADDALTFSEALEARLPARKLDFLAAGVDDGQLARLLLDARTHFENLRRFTARRTQVASSQDRVGWSGDHAEATRYSTLFGLEGRTDLVVVDPEQGLQIIELKSGKPWSTHAGQVQSYALLWQELASQEGLSATGYLLYSKTGQMPGVRLDEGGDAASLMAGRNQLIALYRSYIDPNFDYRPPAYMDHPELCRDNECRFRRDRCKAQTELLGLGANTAKDQGGRTDLDRDLMARARYYHSHLTRLIEMERWSDQVALGSIFQPHRYEERRADGRAASDLTLSGSRTAVQRAFLTGEGLHQFTPGDNLLLHRGAIDTTHLLRGRVIAITDAGELELSLYSGSLSRELLGGGWTADLLPARVGYRTAHRALYRLIQGGSPALLADLLRPELSTPADQPDLESGLNRRGSHLDERTRSLLNDSQQQALSLALQERPITLIQGPPGTGKTTAIAHLAMELVAKKQRVLLAALTNTAVDTMLIKLVDAAMQRGDVAPPPFLRLGSARKSPLLAQALRDHDLDPAHYFADDLAHHTGTLSAIAEYLDDAKIVATTAHSALSHSAMVYLERHRGRPAFDVALIDEASQLTEPMALAPISAARRFVLVGDHRQLPPIVASERALSDFFPEEQIASPLLKAGLKGLDQSLFERLASFYHPQMLTTQYRMHRAIMDFPAEQFYGGRLIAHESVANHTLSMDAEIEDELHPLLRANSPVVFFDVDTPELGRTNPGEAQAILEVASAFNKAAPQATIGILSPFRAQVHLLRRLQAEAPVPPQAQVDTIERFQGHERDIILVSLVKREQPGDFLADPRRLNVALTRARKKLILFGSKSCLEQDPTFRRWLQSPETICGSWKSC